MSDAWLEVKKYKVLAKELDINTKLQNKHISIILEKAKLYLPYRVMSPAPGLPGLTQHSHGWILPWVVG